MAFGFPDGRFFGAHEWPDGEIHMVELYGLSEDGLWSADHGSAHDDYIDSVNAEPKPVRWTKSADDILATIKRFCLRTLQVADRQCEIIRTSESGH